MTINKSVGAVLAVLALGSAGVASAAAVSPANVFTLTFEGVGDQKAVGNFYNGGAGTNYGVSFSLATLALVDEDAGGHGNFANEPSPSTVMFFTNGNNAILTMDAGFTTGFSFFYSSSKAVTVTVWDGLGGTGNSLGSLELASQNTDNCGGDPKGTFCNWTSVGVSFDGTAKSIDFGGTANLVGFDNITFGSSNPGGTVPEPASLALVGAALLGLAAMRRRKA